MTHSTTQQQLLQSSNCDKTVYTYPIEEYSDCDISLESQPNVVFKVHKQVLACMLCYH